MDTQIDWADRKVAVYWDHENIVASHYDFVHGKESWRNDVRKFDTTDTARAKLRDAKVDMDVILGALAPAAVIINRAYGNWSVRAMRCYAAGLQRHAIDAIQMFPTAGTKNGADIRLALDVANDLLNYPEITDVVVIGGDSDYIALAQHCHRHLRRFTNIASSSGASRHLRSAADQTITYEQLLPRPEVVEVIESAEVVALPRLVIPDLAELPGLAAVVGGPPERSTWLLATAISQLAESSEDGWVGTARVRPRMRLIDPGFEMSKGGTIRDLIDKHLNSIVEVRAGQHDREVRVLDAVTKSGSHVSNDAPWETHDLADRPITTELPVAV
jgi:hypothetical protein